jgi:RimJ/RimL family protein N-acetyltransferase
MDIRPVVFEGLYVRLLPLTREHLSAFCAVGLDPELWRWIPEPIQTAEDMKRYIETALKRQKAGEALPFAVMEKSSGTIVGSTRYAHMEPRHRRLEIGWTWVAPAWQRTAVNTECKYLLLKNAFEAMGCLRVELKTNSLNEKSRKAIERIGGRFEGILRNHIVNADGSLRHSAYYSIIDSEWPSVKKALEKMLLPS